MTNAKERILEELFEGPVDGGELECELTNEGLSFMAFYIGLKELMNAGLVKFRKRANTYEFVEMPHAD